MKKRAAIIICFLVFTICAGTVFCSRTEAAIWNILNPSEVPVYPALHKTSERSMVLNGTKMKIVMFKGEDISIPQVVEYYKTILAQKGWQTGGEQILPDNSVVLNFVNKDKRMVSLTFFPGENMGRPNNVFMQMAYTLEGMDQEGMLDSMVKNKDMPGEDISWLKRYPGSIRTQSTSSDMGFILVNYKVLDYSCIECVADFYSQEMDNGGWELVNVVHKTKEDAKANSSILDKIDELFNKSSVAGNSQSSVSYNKEKMKQILDNYSPQELKTMVFQKSADMCTITITYRLPQDHVGLGSESEEEFGDSHRILAGQIMQGQDRERIEIGIIHMPGVRSKARSKKWF